MHVISTTEPVRACATERSDARLVWTGKDDRGVELEVVGLDLPDAIVIVRDIPQHLGGEGNGQASWVPARPRRARHRGPS